LEQLESLVWDWLAFWFVQEELDASDDAELFRFWFAELEPLDGAVPIVVGPTETPSPLTVTGTFALTPFWLAFASELALCVVSEDCESCCACPDPPQPAVQAAPVFWP